MKLEIAIILLLGLVLTASATQGPSYFKIQPDGSANMQDYIKSLQAIFGADTPIIEVNHYSDFKPYCGYSSVYVCRALGNATLVQKKAENINDNESWVQNSINGLRGSTLFSDCPFSLKDVPLAAVEGKDGRWSLLIPERSLIDDSLAFPAMFKRKQNHPVSCVTGFSLETFYIGSHDWNNPWWVGDMGSWINETKTIYLY